MTTTSLLPSSPSPSDQALIARAITLVSVTATQNSRGSDLERLARASSISALPVNIENSDFAFPWLTTPAATTSSSNQPLAFRRSLNAPVMASGTRSWFFLSNSRS